MSLANIFLEMKRRASETGEDRATNLRGGVRLAVRVQSDVVTLTIARQKTRVEDRELITFKEQCGIPPDACRYPAEGQGKHGDAWYVAYRWTEGDQTDD